MEKIKLYGNKKREKGAITLFVLLACLFFVFILTGVYLSNLNKLQVQEQEVQQIYENYARDIDRAEEIYNNLVKTAVVTLRQEPSNGTWTKEVTLIGNAKLDEENTATIKYYTFNQERTENNPSEWDWKAVSENNVKELVEIEHEEKITKNDVYYYFWIKDSDGKIHRSNEVHIQNIDNNAPTAGTLIAKEINDEDKTETEYDLEKSPWTDKDVKIEKVDGTDGEGETETVYTILKDGVEYDGSVTNPRTEPTTLTETGEYTVTVITTDKVGNTVERKYTIKIDKVVPILALKHNDANGVEYEKDTWTKDNLYGEISLDTSKTGKEVEKYQYSENGVIWKDITGEITQSSINYTTKFPMSSDKPNWITGPINNGTYYFEVQADGTLKPNNSGKNNTTANSYFEIDLTNQPNATLEITINATISSQGRSDYGYATITTSPNAPTYNESEGRFIYESGNTSTSDYKTTVTGGQKYYLHIGYRKDIWIAMYQDTFIINSITLKSDTLTKELNFYNFNKNGNTVTFDFKEEMEKGIYIRAVYKDGKTTKYGDKTSVKIDKVAPIIENVNPILLSREEAKADIKVTDKGSGLKGYYISTSQMNPTENSDWIGQTSSEFTIEVLKTSTTYYLWTIDNAGNISERKDIVIETANYLVDNTTTTETLEKAISISNDGSIIKLLGDYTDTSTATFSKNVTFDVQSYTLTRQTTITINSNKTVEIIGTGKITSGENNVNTIINNGTLTVNNNITIENMSTSPSYAPIYINNSNSITNINDNVQIIGYYRGIYNYYGTLNVNGGKIEATYSSSSSYGIYNFSRTTVKLFISAGEIKGYYGVYNGSSSTLEMTGGKVVGTGAEGIYAYGTTNIYGGRIEGKTYGMCGYSTNKITIGREEDELSTTNPAIYGGNYGIYMNNTSYSFNFYNGVIISNTKETAYNGILNPRTKHMPYTYFDYDVEQKYCTILMPAVANITMKTTPTEYTNGDVTVTITYPYVKDTRQYSEDGITWKDTEEYIQEVIVIENKTIYARTMNESGIITDENQIEITNIDKEKPTVTIIPSQTVYTVTETNGTVDLNITLTAQDTGVSGLDIMQYAWVREGQQVTSYTDFNNTVTINKAKLGIGKYNLYINVTDKAGNKADLVQMRYTVKYEEPVCQIGTTKYTTIQAAVEACSKTAGETQTTIEMLKSTDEEFNTYEGQNIILDLKGYTVGSSNIETPLCTNNGTLQLIDSSTEKTGKLESLNGTTILNNGTFTLGDNSTEIEYEVPTIYGYQIGVENNNIFNFYDGKIQGKTPIKGNITDTPAEYGPVSTGYENGITTIQLGIVTGYEARIEWVYYTTVQEAVNATKLYKDGYRDTVTIIKDIQLTNILEVSEINNIILDLDGYTLTVANQNTVINNYGNLEITDNSAKQTGNITISSTDLSYVIQNQKQGELTLLRGTLSGYSSKDFSTIYGINNADAGIINIVGGNIIINNDYTYGITYGIYNVNGIVNIIGGKINSYNNNNGSSAYSTYGIYNAGIGTINVKGGIIDSTCNIIDSRSELNIYGIFNASEGLVKITGGTVESRSNSSFCDTYGVYNLKKGIIEVTGGIVNSINDESNCYGIYNESNGILKITGGEISTISKHSNYGLYNADTGKIEVLGGIISSNCSYYSNQYSYGIYNEKSGEIKIIEGTIKATSSSSDCYGIYNENTGTIEIGEIDENISKEKIIITSTYTGDFGDYLGIGLYNMLGNITFYNGIIQGGTIALSGNITKVRDGYQIENDIIDNKDSIYLGKKVNTEYIVQIDGIKYYTIQEAVNSIEENERKILKILKNFEINEVLKFNKDITLDLRGYTITNNYYKIENIADITIIDTSQEKNGKIENINTIIGILNNEEGNIIIQGGTISSSNNNDSYGIYNIGTGIVEIMGGIINGNSTHFKSYGIYNASTGKVSIIAGIVNCTSKSGWSSHNSYGIYNASTGRIEIAGGTINSDKCYGIYNASTGTIEMTEGMINVNNTDNRYGRSYGMYNASTGRIEIAGGTVSTTNSDSNIDSYSYGIYNQKAGTIEMTEGTIISNNTNEYGKSYGIYNGSTGIVIIGIKNDGMLSQEFPNVIAKATKTSNENVAVGIYNEIGELYFYDGRLEGTSKAVYDIITEYEDNTELDYNEDETILTLTTILTPVAQIGNTTYNTLQEAVNAVGSSQTTIKLLRNVAYTKNDNIITIPNNKNIILDLNGCKISSAIPEKVIENNGILEITDTSVGQTGLIITNEENTIYNTNSGKLIIKNGKIENKTLYSIYNEGEFIIEGGNIITSSNNNSYGVYNTANGSVNMTGGVVNSSSIRSESYANESDSYGIYNNSSKEIKINGGTITSNSTNHQSFGIYNANIGDIIIEKGNISSSSYTTCYGIYNSNIGNIIIGEKGNDVIAPDELIIVTGSNYTNVGYGIYNTEGTLNYYDGTIKGTTKAIYGNISEVEDLTELNTTSETISSIQYEVLTLKQVTTNVARVNGIEYDSIEKAIKACGTTESTIEILRVSDPGATVIIEENQNITIDLKGYIINNYIEMQNKGTFKIKDSSSGQAGKIVGLIGMAISNIGTMELQSGSIAESGYGIKNIGTLTVNGGTISNNTYGIYNDSNGIIDVNSGNLISNTYAIYNYMSTATTNVNSGNITSNTYGIYNQSGTANVSGTAITGNDYGIYNASGTTNIKEGAEVQSDMGLYVAGGRVNIGETGTMNSSSPIVTGETYGLSVSPTGLVYMYDGQIKGKQGATQGFITYTETGYAVANKVEGEYFVDYLALAGTIDAVAEVNGVSYTNLQSAINSVVGEETQTIKLLNGIISDITFNISEGQNIILDMNEKTISSDLDVTINNAGNLTIIDSTSSGVGKIGSTTGTAIVNSGTLTLGQDDGTVSQDLITIEGQTYGIENTGELNFYDGTINGASAVNGTITNRATGYVIRITTVNGKERYYLST